MIAPALSRAWRPIAAFALMWLVAGCGGSGPVKSEVAPSNENLRAVVKSYFQAMHALERPPHSKDEIVPYLKKFGDPTQLLRSPDDGENYVIIYGFDPLDPKLVQNVWAYETRGKDGRRFAVQGRNVIHIDDAAFRNKTFAPGHRPAF